MSGPRVTAGCSRTIPGQDMEGGDQLLDLQDLPPFPQPPPLPPRGECAQLPGNGRACQVPSAHLSRPPSTPSLACQSHPPGWAAKTPRGGEDGRLFGLFSAHSRKGPRVSEGWKDGALSSSFPNPLLIPFGSMKEGLALTQFSFPAGSPQPRTIMSSSHRLRVSGSAE